MTWSRAAVLLVAIGACGFDPPVATDDAAGTVDAAPEAGTPGTCGTSAISASGGHTCVIQDDGDVYCWGLNSQGQAARAPTSTPCMAGGSTFACEPTPVRAMPLAPALALGTGAQGTCAIVADEQVFCWGANDSGQFGGANGDHAEPTRIQERDGSTAIAGGAGHFCSLESDGDVLCSGINVEGQVGNGSLDAQPTPIVAYGDAKSFAVGANNSCAIKSNDDLHCWGRNDELQVDTSGTDARTATRTPNLPDVAAVGVGSQHLCAILLDRTVMCWGGNTSGQLGRGTTSMREGPGLVSGLENVRELDVDNVHACVILDGGSVRCWGEGYGSSPMPIELPRPATQIAVGGYHMCAILDDGAVWCWGLDWYGQRGTGTPNPAEAYQPPARAQIPCD